MTAIYFKKDTHDINPFPDIDRYACTPSSSARNALHAVVAGGASRRSQRADDEELPAALVRLAHHTSATHFYRRELCTTNT
jgi:hypothetical protein